MNENYRSIWSEARGSWVVVSECAPARGKKSRSARVAVAVGLMAAAAAASAATVNLSDVALTSSTDTDAYPKGSGALVTGSLVYNTTTANGLVPGLYMCNGSEWVNTAADTAISASTPYFHANSTVQGNSTLGYTGATGDQAIAAGPNAVASGASSVAVGNGAQASNTNSAAIGTSAQSAFANSVALGSNSTDKAYAQVSGGTINGISYAYAGTAAGVVSVGGAGVERQLVNVAPGAVAAASTDAVNGSQLYATDQAIANLAANGGWKLSTNGNGAAAASVPAGATVDLSPGASGNLKIAQTGTNVTIDTNPNLIATTLTTTDASGNITVVSGTGTTTTDVAGNQTALGAHGIAITPAAGSPVSLTSAGLNNGGNKITNVAPGTVTAASTDAVNGAQLFGLQGTLTGVGLNFADANGDVIHENLGGTLTVIGSTTQLAATSLDISGVATPGSYSSKNVQTYADPTTGKLQIQVADNPIFSSVTTGNTTMSSAGVTVGGGAAPVSLTSAGLDNGGNKITNIAPGALTATSTDAVNGAQLYQTNQEISNLTTTVQKSRTHYYSVNDGGTQGGNYANDGATGAGALAAGVGAAAAGAGGVALGSGASASVLGGIALGADSIASRIAGTYVDPISGHSFTTTAGAVSVGGSGSERQITNVAAGTQTTDAVNLGQLESAMSKFTQTVINQGAGQPAPAWITGNPAAYTAPVASGAGSTAAGSGSSASGKNSTALGDGAMASGANSVALGANSVASADNTVSVGAVGSERTISNLAAGVHGTDAVNVTQLNAGVAAANQYTDSQIGSVRRDMYGGVAAALAVAGLPQPSSLGKSMVAVATANWHGQQGVAVGVSTISENGNWIFKGAVTTSSHGGTGAVVGAGYQW